MSKIIRIDTLHTGSKHNCSTNGDGVRIVVWFLGCDIRCHGCHNQEYWDFNNPKFEDFSQNHIDLVIDEITKYEKIYSGLSVLGGEPFSIFNIDDVIKLCKIFKEKFPNKDIWIWSGYTLKHLNKENDKKINDLLDLCDFLVAGPFVMNKRNINLKFRGSSNQIIWKKKDNKWKKIY